MSEQNSPGEPAHAQSSFGSAPDTPPAPAVSEQFGSAPPHSGPAPEYTQQFGAAPGAGAGSQAAATDAAPSQTVASETAVDPAGSETVGTAPPPPVPAPAPEKKRRTGSIVLQVVGVVAILAIAALLGLFFRMRSTVTFSVGDCLDSQATSTSDAAKTKKVECSSDAAVVKVVGVVDGLTRAQFEAPGNAPCGQYPSAASALWIEDKGESKGRTYCLEPVD